MLKTYLQKNAQKIQLYDAFLICIL